MIFQKLDVENGTPNGFVSFESKIIIVVSLDLVLYNLSSDPLTLSADGFVSDVAAAGVDGTRPP